jgi:DNA-directed RNA polymerase beta' subunit
MIHFLDLDSFIKNLIPITSTEYFTRTEEFNPTGLFSEVIFGPLESKERKTIYSYIDLNCEVIHPRALKLLIQLDRRIKDFISTEKQFSLDSENKLMIDEENGVTGLREFKKLFSMINFRGESEKRDKYIQKLKDAYENKKMFIRYVPVIPPEQRPIYKDEEKNKWMVDNLNDYYINILKKSFHMRSETSEGVLYDLLNYEVQKAVIDHDEYIRTLIQKKSGLIRSQLLGKRTDFSGRAVITPGPELDVNQVGLPLKLAISLFEPFILHKLMYTKIVDHKELAEEIKSFNGMDLSIDAVKQVMKAISIGDILPEKLKKIFWVATESAMEGRVILLKRDPVLHPGSIRGSYPIL